MARGVLGLQGPTREMSSHSAPLQTLRLPSTAHAVLRVSPQSCLLNARHGDAAPCARRQHRLGVAAERGGQSVGCAGVAVAHKELDGCVLRGDRECMSPKQIRAGRRDWGQVHCEWLGRLKRVLLQILGRQILGRQLTSQERSQPCIDMSPKHAGLA